jgi:hypothetical protein
MIRPPLVLALVALAACSSERPQTSAQEERASATTADRAGTAQPAAATERPSPGEAPAQAGRPLTFSPPDAWVASEPSSSMRVAQYQLPGAEGAGDAELVVYYFGQGSGGSVEANVERWAGQFEQPDGSDSMDRLARSERRVLGMPVHEVALSGTFVAETTPGSGVRVNHPDWRLLAAIVESDHGAYYLKLTGPQATVDAHQAAFRTFVSEIR